MSLDLDYLLALQNFRVSTGDLFTPLMEWVSDLAISFWPLAALCLVYWVVSKRIGTSLFFAYNASYLINGFLKLTACVYRPWIRDAAIIPAGDAITTATGYSFPSGHATIATAIYGGGAVQLWKRRGLRIAAVALIALLLVTMFSRNYLGVHTPQDVIVGFGVTLAVVLVAPRVMAWAEEPVRNRDLKFVAGGVILVALLLVYITVKPYPLDYVDGVLLVDPEDMMPDTFFAAGGMLGFLIGWLVERRLIGFKTGGDWKRATVIAVIALIPLYLINEYFLDVVDGAMGLSAAKFSLSFLEIIYIFVVVPAALKRLNPQKD